MKPIIGVSSCLLGEEVRYNGGHKRHNWLNDHLGQHVEFRPLCPEVGIGLPVPRPTLRIIQTDLGQRAVDSDTQTQDVTEQLQQFYQQHQQSITELDGYVLMQNSPSCGMERVKVYGEGVMPEKKGVGIFAQELLNNHPSLPIEESGRLNDAPIAESFLTRLFVHHEWRTTKPFQNAKALIRFHSRHKFLIMLHNYQSYKVTGKQLSDLSDDKVLPLIAQQYFAEVMAALKTVSTVGQRTNALLHLFGFLKKYLVDSEKKSVLEQIERYRQAQSPYVVALTLLRHYASVYQQQDPYLWQQSVWSPYPETLNQYKNIV